MLVSMYDKSHKNPGGYYHHYTRRLNNLIDLAGIKLSYKNASKLYKYVCICVWYVQRSLCVAYV